MGAFFMIKKKNRIVSFLILILISAIFITSPAFSKENTLTVNVGENFQIELDSNITTGYQWKIAKPLKKSLIKLKSSRYINLQPNVMGAGGKEIWTFTALKKGKTKINFAYSRAWEKTKPAKQKIYTVEIK